MIVLTSQRGALFAPKLSISFDPRAPAPPWRAPHLHRNRRQPRLGPRKHLRGSPRGRMGHGGKSLLNHRLRRRDGLEASPGPGGESRQPPGRPRRSGARRDLRRRRNRERPSGGVSRSGSGQGTSELPGPPHAAHERRRRAPSSSMSSCSSRLLTAGSRNPAVPFVPLWHQGWPPLVARIRQLGGMRRAAVNFSATEAFRPHRPRNGGGRPKPHLQCLAAGQRQKSEPSSSRKRLSTMRCTSSAPSTRRA